MIPLFWHRTWELEAKTAVRAWRSPRRRRFPLTVERFEDRTLLAATLVSVNGAGTGSGNADSRFPATSANGQVVAFVSLATDLVATNDTNATFDVFARDLQAGTTTLVSVNRAGTNSGDSASAENSAPVLSADGRFVAFESFASDLVANDTNNDGDVFVRDLQAGTTTLVSVNSGGTASGNGRSSRPVLSTSGRFVAFQSDASNLVAKDTNNRDVPTDVFVRDLVEGSTTLVSVNRAGTDSGNGPSSAPALSADGRFVAFESSADDLVAISRNNNTTDVFVRDLVAGTTTLVSVNGAGTASGNSESGGLAMSADGRIVAFFSLASDLVASDANNRSDVFVRDLVAGRTTLVSLNRAGTDSGNGFSGNDIIALSADGRFVAFESDADDLVTNDTNGSASDIFAASVVRGVPAPSADLAVSETAVPDQGAMVGQDVTYTVNVTNAGPDPATGVTLTDTLDPRATFVSATGGATPVGRVLTFHLGSLAVGGTATVTIVVTPTVPGALTGTAVVTGNEDDPSPTNNRTQMVTPTVASPIGDTTGPTLVKLQRFGFHADLTFLVVTYSEPVDSARALDPANYTVRGLGRDGRFGTPDDPIIPIHSLRLGLAPNSVVLRMKRRLYAFVPFQLTINGKTSGAVADQAGNRLDGDHDGEAGGNFVRRFNRRIIAGAASDLGSADVTSMRGRVRGSVSRGRHLPILAGAVLSPKRRLPRGLPLSKRSNDEGAAQAYRRTPRPIGADVGSD
jgi:uncharacterized repeat protein (TIGR01451 family)